MGEQAYVLAGDVGGTNLRVAAVAGDGTILHQVSNPTPDSGTAADIISAIVRAARDCTDVAGLSGPPAAFGLAIAALVDSVRGQIFSSPNLPQLNKLALADDLAADLNLKVFIENDATAAAIGEDWLGAARDAAHSICVTLGTGVGGGLILDGRPYRGADGTAGEIGHICVEPDGVECGCGSRGCVEQYASATAIVRIARDMISDSPESQLGRKAELTAKAVSDAAAVGDPVALQTFAVMGRYLGIALADLVDVLNPEVIVIGGGAAAAWPFFIDHVRAEVRSRAFPTPADRVELVRAALGDSAGILGAARVALRSV